MPIGKKHTTDNTLYALIIFVLLFIIATTIAVIYYLKYEEQRGLADTAQRQIGELAASAELQKLGSLVGTEQPRKSRLRTMLDYLDQSLTLLLPGLPGETSAEVKINEATAKVRELTAGLSKKYPELGPIDPNISLMQINQKLDTALKNTKDSETAINEQLKILQNRFDDAMKASLDKEKALLEEKDKYQQQFEKVRGDYEELRALLEKKTGDQVQDLYAKLDQERTNREELNRQLLRNQAELRTAEERIQRILEEKVWPLQPPPDVEVKAFEPDGKIILIDDQARIVHINLGKNDRVYRGLTFSVYDKNQPIPRDGKGKAEIEVYNVEDSISAARIVRSQTKNPIVVDDIVANLIWDSSQVNTFVVSGDFDLNGDGQNDPDALEKIKGLIKKWGGTVAESVSVNTDFVVLGTPPDVPSKPKLEEIEVYPNAMERYERAMQELDKYRQIESQAQALSIPILNADRFLYFIGYKTQAGEPGAF